METTAKKLLKQKLALIGLKLLHRILKPMPLEFQGKTIHLCPKVFSPKGTLTSLFLAENLEVEEGDIVLDMGCGTGIQAIVASEKAYKVVATDINPHAINCTRFNIKLNHLEHKVEARTGDLFQPVKNEKFSLVIFTPPYMPGKPKSMIELAWYDAGGLLVKKFFEEGGSYLKPKGRIQMVYSTIGVWGLRELEELVKRNGFKIKYRLEKKTLLETLTLYSIVRAE